MTQEAGEALPGKDSGAQSPSSSDPAVKDPGSWPGRVRFAPVYQILIGAPRWEPPLSTGGYTVSGSSPE